MSRRFAATLVLAGAVVSASCATSVTGSAGSATPATSTSSVTSPAGPSSAGAGEWVADRDPSSGIGFSLPGKAKVQTRPGDDGTPDGKRAYQVQASDEVSVSVTIVDGATTAEALDVLPDQLAEQMKAAGAADATVGERSRTTVDGRPALDFQFSFTATNGKRNFWLTREIAAEQHILLLQSIGFSATPGPAFVNRVRDYHRQLLAGLALA